jgi:hypothetical protein
MGAAHPIAVMRLLWLPQQPGDEDKAARNRWPAKPYLVFVERTKWSYEAWLCAPLLCLALKVVRKKTAPILLN